VLLVGVVVTSTAMVIAMGVGTKPVEAAFPGTNGKIAFNSDRDGNSEIYRMNFDGTPQQNLTLSSDRDVTAEWSPNGKQMAFFSDRDGNFEVYPMNSDGTRIRRLTFNGAQDFLPAWSPDGTKIAFQSNRTGDAEVFVMTRTARVLGTSPRPRGGRRQPGLVQQRRQDSLPKQPGRQRGGLRDELRRLEPDQPHP
jgi:dipeptidyl aminopeptidase/acylaminoacyl peptidase